MRRVFDHFGRLLRVREGSTLAILLLEIVFFGWYLWPESAAATIRSSMDRTRCWC